MRKVVRTDQAPDPIGPYSQGVVAEGRFVFVSGMGPLNPATKQMELGSIEEQTRLTLSNVKAIVEAAGSDMAHVVRCGVFLADMSEFKAMNEVYGTFFGENAPARTTVQAVLPVPGMKVEIDAVAVLPEP